MNLIYVQERIAELEAAIINCLDLPANSPRKVGEMISFYRGQLHVWHEVQRSMSKVSA